MNEATESVKVGFLHWCFSFGLQQRYTKKHLHKQKSALLFYPVDSQANKIYLRFLVIYISFCLSLWHERRTTYQEPTAKAQNPAEATQPKVGGFYGLYLSHHARPRKANKQNVKPPRRGNKPNRMNVENHMIIGKPDDYDEPRCLNGCGCYPHQGDFCCDLCRAEYEELQVED